MNRKQKDMLIFDLDGTLWDSGKAVADSWNEVLVREDPTQPLLTEADIHGIMGLTMTQISGILVPGLREERREAFFKACEIHEVEYLRRVGGTLYPDLRVTMEKLRAMGYELAVVSNCQQDYVPAFFASAGVGDLFGDYEEWGRTGREKGENIRLVMERNGYDRAIYIGDTAGDEKAARKAGCAFIHAAYGFGQAEAPDAILSALHDLPEVVTRLNT